MLGLREIWRICTICQCNSCKSIAWFCSVYWTLNESESELWMYIGRIAPNCRDLTESSWLTPVHISSDWTVEWSIPPPLTHLLLLSLLCPYRHIIVVNSPMVVIIIVVIIMVVIIIVVIIIVIFYPLTAPIFPSQNWRTLCLKMVFKDVATLRNIVIEERSGSMPSSHQKKRKFGKRNTLSASTSPLLPAIFLYQWPASWSAIITFQDI